MDIEQLKTFISLTKTKNFTRTAEELNVVQSTVTTRIKLLEEFIGEKLFIRKTRSVEITEAGRTFQTYAQKTIEVMSEGIEAARTRTQFHNRIVIGGLNSIWDSPIFDIVKKFYKENERTAIRLVTGHSQDIIEKIYQGIMDIGFVYVHPRSSAYKVLTFGNESISLVGSKEFAIKSRISLKEIKKYPYIHFHWGSPFSEWFEQEIGKHESMRLRVDSTSVFLRMLVNGDGIGFLLDHIAEPFIKNGDLQRLTIEIAKLPPSRPIYVIYLSEREDKVKPFLDFLNLKE